MWDFPKYFSFTYFQVTSCCLQKLGLSSLNFALILNQTILVSVVQMFQFALHSKTIQQKCLRFFKKLKTQCALQGLTKLNLLREVLFLWIILHQDVNENQNATKETSFGAPCVDLSSNLQPLKDGYTHFSGLFQFQPYFGHYLLDLEIGTKLIKLCPKF